MSDQPTFRFAPSPNGELHLGHAYSALITAADADRFGGRLLLRIEDIDTGRCRPEFEMQILDDLAWLGLAWETPVRRQSEHFSTYGKAVETLDQLGLLYPCFATRREIAEAAGPEPQCDPDGAILYPGLCRELDPGEASERRASGEPFALRLRMDRAMAMAQSKAAGEITFQAFDGAGGTQIHPIDPARWGDVVIARKDVPTSYHLAVVVDDALQGVSHVTRGKDLLASTDVHRLLQILLDLPEPAYHHHDLILDDEGRKLSKRDKDTGLSALRAAGWTPEMVRARVGLADGPQGIP